MWFGPRSNTSPSTARWPLPKLHCSARLMTPCFCSSSTRISNSPCVSATTNSGLPAGSATSSGELARGPVSGFLSVTLNAGTWPTAGIVKTRPLSDAFFERRCSRAFGAESSPSTQRATQPPSAAGITYGPSEIGAANARAESSSEEIPKRFDEPYREDGTKHDELCFRSRLKPDTEVVCQDCCCRHCCCLRRSAHLRPMT